MKEPVKINVIIATRERASTLVYALRTVVAQDYENLTIIVSDNCSKDNTKEVVDSFQDARIKYIKTEKRVGMANNYEFALSHVKEGWVMYIGDDDALLPGALTKLAQIIKETGCLAVISELCYYDWPGVLTDNKLRVPFKGNGGIEWRDAHQWLGKVMRGEACSIELPYVYTGGAVDLSVINRARASNGNFFCAFVPDVYSEIALSSVLDRYIKLNSPLTVSGRSSYSIGASTWGQIKNEAPAQQYFLENSIPFDDRLKYKHWPKSHEIELYECYLKSEHCHHDFLKLKMEDQLGLGLARAVPEAYADIREYCIEIAARNGIDMMEVNRQEKIHRKGESLRYWQERIDHAFKSMVLSGKEFGVHDVYEASLLAKAVYLLETSYSHWRIRKLFQGVKKFFNRCH